MKHPSRASTAMIFLLVAAFGISEAKRQDDGNRGLGFVPLNEDEGQNLLSGRGSGYGYIAEESGKFCLELPGGKNAKKNEKLRLAECDPENERKQVWMVEGYNSNMGEFRGTLRSKVDENLCVEVKRKNQEGARLRVGRCRKQRKSNQQWTSDGKSLKLVEIRELCAYHRGTHPNHLGEKSIVLRECADSSIPPYEYSERMMRRLQEARAATEALMQDYDPYSSPC